MKLPKITFRAMTFKENMDMLAMFIHDEITEEQKPNTDFFRNYYSELRSISFTEDMTEKQINELLRPVLLNSWNKDMKNAEQKIKEIQADWDLINDSVMLDLSKRLNIAWPEDALTIQARVGIMYFCPRYISQRTYDTSILLDTNNMREVAIHEITHFLYFEKWKELYNDHDEEHYNHPNIAWYLSEAIIEPLLNTDTFRKYTNQEIYSNSDMYEIEVDGKNIVHTLKEIVHNNSIEDGIRVGYDYFLQHEKVIKGIDQQQTKRK